MKKLLILGGTNFIGRTLVERLMDLGEYEITLFNRGKSNAQLFPEVRKIIGDRESEDIQQLFEQDWDYVIDCSCYFPGSVEQMVQKIKPSLKRYIFISTCSVYDNEQLKMMLRDEEAPLLSCSEDEALDPDNSTYGKRKAEAERILRNSSFNYSIFRPALVYGPYDPTDRFYYWLYQIQNDQPLLIPNHGQQPFSLTYVHDLVEALISSLNETQPSAVYNITSHPTASIARIVEAASKLLKKETKKHDAPSAFLKNENVAEWMDLPLWLDCDYFTYSNQKIKTEMDLKPREFESSLKETIVYFEKLHWPLPTFGMSDERKNELLIKLTNK